MLLAALLNPVAVAVALWLGRGADQWQKLPVAAFASAMAGSVVLYFVVWLGWSPVAGVGRAAAGVFVAQFLAGLAWASAGYLIRPRG